MEENLEEVPSMSPRDVQERMARDRPLALLDVRTESERELVRLEDDLWVPMDRLMDRLEAIRALDRPRVVYCHHGLRSHRAARVLMDRGFRDVYNLAGGIDAWAQQVDPEMPRY